MPSRAKGQPGWLTKEVAAILRGQLRRINRTQSELAEKADISQSQVSKILRGERHVDVDQLDRMCAALGLMIADVVREADDETNTRELPLGLRYELDQDEVVAKARQVLDEAGPSQAM